MAPPKPARRSWPRSGCARFIAREVETSVARVLVACDVRDGAVIKVGLTDGKLAISYDNPA